MTRINEEIQTFVEQFAKDNGLDFPDDSKPTLAWLAGFGLEPSQVFNQDRVNYLIYRLALGLAGNGLKYSATAQPSYLKLISAFHKKDEAGTALRLKKTLATEASQLFYASSRPVRYDLYNHMCAGELFFVDLDSLVLDALCNYHVHWQNMQTLHVLYLIRKRLSDYIVRGGKLHVIEFECSRTFWGNAPVKALIREIASFHIEKLCAAHSIPFKRFGNWWDAPFRDYLSQFGPEFVVVHDGEQLLPANETTCLEFSLCLNDGEAKSLAEPLLLGDIASSVLARNLFRSLILALIAYRTHVVYTSRQVYKDNAIVAFVNRAHSSKFQPLTRFLPALREWWAEVGVSPPRPSFTDAAVVASIDSVFGLQACRNSRELIVVLATKELLASKKDALKPLDLTLAKTFLITALIQTNTTAEQRAQSAPKPTTKDYAAHLDALAGPLAFWVGAFAADKDGIDATVTDLVDGRFWLVLAKWLQGEPNLGAHFSPETIALIEKCWKFCAPSKELRPVEPIGELPALGAAPPVKEVAPDPSLGLHSVDNEIGTLTEYEWNTRANLVNFDVPPGVLIEEKARKELVLKTGRERNKAAKKAMRNAANFAKSIQETAQSMGDIAFLGKNESSMIVRNERAQEKEKEETERRAEAASHQQARRGKPVVSEAEKIKRKNILDKANEALLKAEKQLLEKIRSGDEMTRFAEQCELPYRQLLSVRPDDDAEKAERQRMWSLFFAAKAAAKSEFQFVFDKTSAGVFTALDHVRSFVDSHTTEAKDLSGAAETAQKSLATYQRVDGSTKDGVAAIAAAKTFDECKRGLGDISRGIDDLLKAPKHDESLKPTVAILDKLKTRLAPFLAKAGQLDQVQPLAAEFAQFLQQKLAELQQIAAAKAEAAFNDVKRELFPAEDIEEKEIILRALYLRCFESHIRFRARVAQVEISEKSWARVKAKAIAECRLIDDDEWPTATSHFQTIHEAYRVIERTRIRVRPDERNKLRKALQNLDLPTKYLALVDAQNQSWEGEKNPFEALPPLPASIKPVITDSATRFQMLRMGHLFPRPVPSETDARVPFRPDDWQRELLDVVDRKGRAVVCAPTSAGKTFISYYCMKNVLRTSNEDVVVYVAPTRALINQAMSDVYARYGSKEYPADSSSKVYGCLGGQDYVVDPFHCQVLITLPETFESLLLSPKYQHWASRIKYVIFDEIHSIDNGANGDVWERLLMLVRAPFVALSATIGETQQLADWLNRVQARLVAQGVQGQDCHVSVIPSAGKIQRWSDIEKHAYLPESQAPFRRLHRDRKSAFEDKALLPIHPMSCVTVEMLQSKFPEDLPFVPRESIELYDAMKQASQPLRKTFRDVDLVVALTKELNRLNPETYFEQVLTISQKKAREYEAELKAEVLRWGRYYAKDYGTFEVKLCKDDKKAFRKEISAMLTTLLANFKTAVATREEELGVKVAAAEEERKKSGSTAPLNVHFPDTTEFVIDSMLNALSSLQRQDKLPAIVFSFEEEDCNRVVEAVVSRLERAEAEYRATDDFAAYKKKIEANRAKYESDLKTMQGYRGKTLEEGDDGSKQVREEGGRVESVDTTLVIEVPEVLEQFTFSSTFSVVSKEEMEDILRDMDPRRLNTDLVLRAFKRGIGIHHPGIKGKIRIHFERLFRLRFLPVIFATQTLALGVHSPCRTVVLAGDHVELNTMQFRQMAGRAGRRGQDMRGFCVFMGVPFRKIQRLMTSDLTVLKGHVQLDSVTNLRLEQLRDHRPDNGLKKREREEETVDPAHVKNLEECLQQEPLFFHGRRSCAYQKFQMAHAKALEGLFQTLGLKFSQPVPTVATLGAMVTRVLNVHHEVFVGNSAFTFASLLQSGFFHRLCEDWRDEDTELDSKSNREILYAFTTILSYLFSLQTARGVPLEIHRSVLSDPARSSIGTVQGQHLTFLPGIRTMPYRFAKAIEDHNVKVLAQLSKLMATLGQDEKSAEGGKERPALPLASDDTLLKEKQLFPKKSGADPIFAKLEASRIKYFARSPFIALAGLGDNFDSAEDLIHSLRSKLFIDCAHIPLVDFVDIYRHDRSQVLLNSCVLDWAQTRSQTIDGQRQRYLLEVLNGLGATISFEVLEKFITAVDNLTEFVQRIGPKSRHPGEEEDDSQDSYIRSKKGNLLACCNPSCTINDQEDLKRYNKRVIRGKVWRCIECWRGGKETFMCEECVNADGSVCSVEQGETRRENKDHHFQPYIEDSFASALIQLAAHCDEWIGELTGGSYSTDESRRIQTKLERVDQA